MKLYVHEFGFRTVMGTVWIQAGDRYTLQNRQYSRWSYLGSGRLKIHRAAYGIVTIKIDINRVTDGNIWDQI
jgi:hypothetical protein